MNVLRSMGIRAVVWFFRLIGRTRVVRGVLIVSEKRGPELDQLDDLMQGAFTWLDEHEPELSEAAAVEIKCYIWMSVETRMRGSPELVNRFYPRFRPGLDGGAIQTSSVLSAPDASRRMLEELVWCTVYIQARGVGTPEAGARSEAGETRRRVLSHWDMITPSSDW